jgi:hypothetical protein
MLVLAAQPTLIFLMIISAGAEGNKAIIKATSVYGHDESNYPIF